ncbi:MAG: helix-turn-helix domain-containing protein [Acidimicrobiia bacterium]|nr:helix-turn-helix domain-containing protein [Acidimicrobiia bacterium]
MLRRPPSIFDDYDDEAEDLVGLRQAAARLGLQPEELRRLAVQRQIMHYELEGNIRFAVDDLNDWLERQPSASPPRPRVVRAALPPPRARVRIPPSMLDPAARDASGVELFSRTTAELPC